MITEHTRPDNVKGLTQVLTTLAPLSALWFVAVKSVGISYWLPAGVTVLMSLFLIRVLVLLHECGHGSLFRTAQLNQTFGFLFGVVSGMPQYLVAASPVSPFHERQLGKISRPLERSDD